MARKTTPAKGLVMASSNNPVMYKNNIKVTLDGSGVTVEEGQGLYECLKPVLLFCKLIGLVPFTNCPATSLKKRDLKR